MKTDGVMVSLGAIVLNRLALPLVCLLAFGGRGGAADADAGRGADWALATQYAGPGGSDKSRLKVSIGPSAPAAPATPDPETASPPRRSLRPPAEAEAVSTASAVPAAAERAAYDPDEPRRVERAVHERRGRAAASGEAAGDDGSEVFASPYAPPSGERLRALLDEEIADSGYRRQWPFNGEEWATADNAAPAPTPAPAPKPPAVKRPVPAKAPIEPKKEVKKETPKKPDSNGPVVSEASVYGELLYGMLAVGPHDFDAPVRAVPMTLREIAGSVIRNNRTIQAASFKPEQARAGIMEAKSVYDPVAFADWTHSRTDAPPAMLISGYSFPNREYRNEVARSGLRQRLPSGGEVSAYREWSSGIERNPGSDPDRGHGGAYVLEINQPLLNGFLDAENRTILEISRLQYDSSNEEFRKTVIDTMADTFEAYWTVALARENVRINEECLDMAERLLEREAGRKDEGIANELDVNRAREAVATRAYNLLLSREQHLQAQEDLKYKINDRAAPVGMEVHVDVIEPLDMPLMKVDIEKTIDSALLHRPEMHSAELALRATAARRRFAKHSLLPEVNLTGSIRHNDRPTTTPTSGSSTTNTGTDWSLGVAFSMPLGNMQARANLRRTDAEMSQYQEEKRNMRDLVITEIRTIGKSLEMVVREIPQNRRAMEAAAKVLEGEWAKLELNQTGNRDLLQAQDLVAVAEKNYIQSLVRYNVYIVQLLAAEGVLLDKMGIRLQGR